jgi:hypothetical protein
MTEATKAMRFKSARQQLLYARDEAEILRLLRHAMAELSAVEIAVLPPECRDIPDASALHDVAVSCLHHDLRCRADPEIGELIRQVAELYAAASVRLSHLHHQRA